MFLGRDLSYQKTMLSIYNKTIELYYCLHYNNKLHLLVFVSIFAYVTILLIMDNDIKAYDTYRNIVFGEKGLPENVRHELNIDSLCEKLDFTSSCIGRQYLYHIVCKDEISEVRDNESLIKELHDDIPLRKQLIGLLGKLNKPDAYTITELLYGKNTDYSQSYIHTINICRWLPLVFLLCTFLSNIPGQFLIFLLASYIVNCYLHLKQKSQLSLYYFSIPQLYILIQTARKIAGFSIFADTDRNIHHYINNLKELTKKLRLFRISINLDSNAAMPLFMFTELLDKSCRPSPSIIL